MSTRLDEVYAEILPMLEENGFADTPCHRIWALQGLIDGWREVAQAEIIPTEETMARAMYFFTVEMEIIRLKLVVPREEWDVA